MLLSKLLSKFKKESPHQCGIILAHPRSGSSELSRSLRLCDSKVFMEPFHRTMSEKGIHATSEKFEPYINDTLSSNDVIKHMWTGFPEEKTLNILEHQLSGNVLLLERQDVFSTAVSFVVARMTKNYNRNRPQTLDQPIPVQEVSEYMNFIFDGQASWRQKLRELNINHKLITYEELFSNETIEEANEKLSDICHLFNLNFNPEASKLLMPNQKYSSNEFYESAPNWEEVYELSDKIRL